mgnify:CR=1 FL=1
MGEKNINNKFVDCLRKERGRKGYFDLPLARYVSKHKNSSTFFSKHGKVESFFTEDSKKYITPSEYRKIKKGEALVRTSNRLDSALSRCFEKNRIYPVRYQERQYFDIQERYSDVRNYVHDWIRGAVQGVSVARMWNLSIVGAVIFGMLTMTMVYRYLGQGVSAAVKGKTVSMQEQQDRETGYVSSGQNVIEFGGMDGNEVHDIDTEFITKLLEIDKEASISQFEKQLQEMVEGYPIEKMVPEIARKDRTVAAFMVAIAKKESNWGKRVPVLDGQDCFNYWGYRGIRDRMGTGGHTCFDSTKDAVDTVAKRISTLVEEYGRNTPSEMVVWKCGSDCEVTGGQAAANKWISDVAMYFNELK